MPGSGVLNPLPFTSTLPGAGLRLLVVDDEAQMLELLELTLSMQGFAVSTARNGPEALALALNCEYDALVMDVLMTPWDGLETVRALYADCAGPLPPVVFLSGLDRSAELLGLPPGIPVVYLMKPFRPAQLVEALLNVIRKE